MKGDKHRDQNFNKKTYKLKEQHNQEQEERAAREEGSRRGSG